MQSNKIDFFLTKIANDLFSSLNYTNKRNP
jgi:hypothetical protein